MCPANQRQLNTVMLSHWVGACSKWSLYQYRYPHYEDKTVSRPSCLYNGNESQYMHLERQFYIEQVLGYKTSWQYDLLRDKSRYAPTQWEMLLHCNDISHWLGAYLDWSLLKGCASCTPPAIKSTSHLYRSQPFYFTSHIKRQTTWNACHIARTLQAVKYIHM